MQCHVITCAVTRGHSIGIVKTTMEKDDTKIHAPLSEPTDWVEQHGDYLYRYALGRLRDADIAADLVQETFLAALQAREQFAGRSHERTWFVGILKRKIVDHFRKSGREISLEDPDTVGEELDKHFLSAGGRSGMWKSRRRPADWMIDPADPAEQEEFREFLQRCLDELHPRLAVVFVLREMEELENEKICNTLDIRPTNLRVMLHRARLQLRRCLELNWIGVKKRAQ